VGSLVSVSQCETSDGGILCLDSRADFVLLVHYAAIRAGSWTVGGFSGLSYSQ
jgi:hypothetical protein